VSIDITDLRYTYPNRDVPALRDVSLTFRAGDVALIAGKSGSGKTTLIRCINGLIPRSYQQGTLSGQIRYSGESTSALSLAQIARHIGTVMQDPDKQIVATRAFNEIAFGPENLGLPRDEIVARVHSAAKQMRVDHLLERETHTLSGGEQQRMVIAAVLAMQPQALLLDEPLASLDPPSAREALAHFRRLADEGITIVMVEHRVRDALRIEPEQCVVLADGAIAFQGDAAAYRTWLDDRRQIDNERPIANRQWMALRGATPIANLLLSFHDAHFTYPSSPHPQLNGVSLNVHAGDVIALIGPNGAGKSTLCKLAIGINRPSAGGVRLGERDAKDMTVAQIVREVGYVFQNPAAMLFANTLRDELSFGPRNTGMSVAESERNIAQAMAIVGLEDIPLDRSPFGLSFGQQKRVAVASVLTMQPKVLILDEPTAGLDDGTAEDLLTRLLNSDGAPQAVIMVTHDLALARHFANRVVLMREGAIVADGAPQDVLENGDVMTRGGLA
jgi:energy-coupling factor transport system ATP-binding protein